MNYFISDLHFGHNNILKYDSRPFQNTDEMDEKIISNWNDTVTDNDDVYILGDVSWKSVPETIEIFKKLKGKKHLIKGNHDGSFLKDVNFRNLFTEITDYKELYQDINGENKMIVLCHYPILFFKNQHHRSLHFYGHVHNSQDWNFVENSKWSIQQLYADDCCQMYNVGCMIDYMDYTPRTAEQIVG